MKNKPILLLSESCSLSLIRRFMPGKSNLAILLFLSCFTVLSCSDGPTETPGEEEATFTDVPLNHEAWQEIEAVHEAGVIDGCRTNPLSFCPNDPVTREDMTVFLLRALLGRDYMPPPATGIFDDVPVENRFAAWVESAVSRGITGGCGGGNFCPDSPVTRGQMSVFLLKTLEGSDYSPPDATGNVFGDVPSNQLFAPFIEALAEHGGTAIGCSITPPNFCPGDGVTRSQMAIFVARIFNLV